MADASVAVPDASCEEDCYLCFRPAFRGRATKLACVSYRDFQQSCFAKPARNLGATESEPAIMLFGSKPFVLMRIGICDDQPSPGFKYPTHLANGARRVRSVVQYHVGENHVNLS